MPSESIAVSIMMPGQGTVLADRHGNVVFYRVCPDGRTGLIHTLRAGRLQPAPAALELLVRSGAELCPLPLRVEDLQEHGAVQGLVTHEANCLS